MSTAPAYTVVLDWLERQLRSGRLPNNTVRLPHVAPTQAELEQIRADLSTSVAADTLTD